MLRVNTGSLSILENDGLGLCLAWAVSQGLNIRTEEMIRDMIGSIIDTLCACKSSSHLPSTMNSLLDVWIKLETAKKVRKEQGFQAGRITPEESFTEEAIKYYFKHIAESKDKHQIIIFKEEQDSGFSSLDTSDLVGKEYPRICILEKKRSNSYYRTGHFVLVNALYVDNEDSLQAFLSRVQNDKYNGYKTLSLNNCLSYSFPYFVSAVLLTKELVLHQGSCGYASAAYAIQYDKGLKDFIHQITDTLSDSSDANTMKFANDLNVAVSHSEFETNEFLPPELWCNGDCLDAISRRFGVIILVFATCFETSGFVLKSVYDCTLNSRCSAVPPPLIAIHHQGDYFNPLYPVSSNSHTKLAEVLKAYNNSESESLQPVDDTEGTASSLCRGQSNTTSMTPLQIKNHAEYEEYNDGSSCYNEEYDDGEEEEPKEVFNDNLSKLTDSEISSNQNNDFDDDITNHSNKAITYRYITFSYTGVYESAWPHESNRVVASMQDKMLFFDTINQSNTKKVQITLFQAVKVIYHQSTLVQKNQHRFYFLGTFKAQKSKNIYIKTMIYDVAARRPGIVNASYLTFAGPPPTDISLKNVLLQSLNNVMEASLRARNIEGMKSHFTDITKSLPVNNPPPNNRLLNQLPPRVPQPTKLSPIKKVSKKQSTTTALRKEKSRASTTKILRNSANNTRKKSQPKVEILSDEDDDHDDDDEEEEEQDEKVEEEVDTIETIKTITKQKRESISSVNKKDKPSGVKEVKALAQQPLLQQQQQESVTNVFQPQQPQQQQQQQQQSMAYEQPNNNNLQQQQLPNNNVFQPQQQQQSTAVYQQPTNNINNLQSYQQPWSNQYQQPLPQLSNNNNYQQLQQSTVYEQSTNNNLQQQSVAYQQPHHNNYLQYQQLSSSQYQQPNNSASHQPQQVQQPSNIMQQPLLQQQPTTQQQSNNNVFQQSNNNVFQQQQSTVFQHQQPSSNNNNYPQYQQQSNQQYQQPNNAYYQPQPQPSNVQQQLQPTTQQSNNNVFQLQQQQESVVYQQPTNTNLQYQQPSNQQYQQSLPLLSNNNNYHHQQQPQQQLQQSTVYQQPTNNYLQQQSTVLYQPPANNNLQYQHLSPNQYQQPNNMQPSSMQQSLLQHQQQSTTNVFQQQQQQQQQPQQSQAYQQIPSTSYQQPVYQQPTQPLVNQQQQPNNSSSSFHNNYNFTKY